MQASPESTKTAVRDSRNSTAIYNARAIEGSRSDQRMLGRFKKLRFAHKYKDLPEEQKEALYLQEIVDEFAFEPEDTARLHQLRTAADARKYEALRALPKFGVATYSNVKETDADLAEKAIRGWAYLFEGQNGQQALCEARKELDGLVEGANGDPPLPGTPKKLERQKAFKGTPPPLALPPMKRQHTNGQPQTTFAFDELAAPSPTEKTPDAKPAPTAAALPALFLSANK